MVWLLRSASAGNHSCNGSVMMLLSPVKTRNWLSGGVFIRVHSIASSADDFRLFSTREKFTNRLSRKRYRITDMIVRFKTRLWVISASNGRDFLSRNQLIKNSKVSVKPTAANMLRGYKEMIDELRGSTITGNTTQATSNHCRLHRHHPTPARRKISKMGTISQTR